MQTHDIDDFPAITPPPPALWDRATSQSTSMYVNTNGYTVLINNVY